MVKLYNTIKNMFETNYFTIIIIYYSPKIKEYFYFTFEINQWDIRKITISQKKFLFLKSIKI